MFAKLSHFASYYRTSSSHSVIDDHHNIDNINNINNTLRQTPELRLDPRHIRYPSQQSLSHNNSDNNSNNNKETDLIAPHPALTSRSLVCATIKANTIRNFRTSPLPPPPLSAASTCSQRTSRNGGRCTFMQHSKIKPNPKKKL